MYKSAQFIDPIQDKDWDQTLLCTKGYSFFHSSSWARVLVDSYGYKPFYVVLPGDNGGFNSIPLMEVRSLFTGKRAVSLPFSDHCEPIIKTDGFFERLWELILNEGKRRGWRSVEIRGGGPYFSGITPSSSFYRHILDLEKQEATIFGKLRPTTRGSIRKAQKGGVEVQILSSLNALKVFYRLNCITRRRHGLPPQPFSFFENVFVHILLKDLGSVALARYKGEVVAGAVFFHIGAEVIYKYGATDRARSHPGASHLLLWRAIEWYHQKGFKHLDFGRTELEHEGLRRFKRGWGVKEITLNYYKYDLQKDVFLGEERKGGGRYHRVLQRLPIPLLRFLGSVLYRHTG